MPVTGIAVAFSLFIVATIYYPGGTTDTTSTVGYSWAHNFVCSLFRPRALNGVANAARYFAVPAILLLCVSLGVMFRRISLEVESRVHKKTIEISGIGSAVYSFLVVTPMHDLMVDIGLLFCLVALLATTHALYIERRWLLFGWGTFCVTLSLLSAAMYYGKTLYGLLPVVQKVSLAAVIGWLMAVYYTKISPERGRNGAEQRDRADSLNAAAR